MKKPSIDLNNFDTSVKPTDNFFQYVNGGWLKANPIPLDQSVWGSFYVLRENVLAALYQIVEKIGVADHPDGSNAQKIKNFYSTGMNDVKLHTEGAQPIAPELENIRTIDGGITLAKVLAQLHRSGIPAIWSVGVGQDLKQNDVMALYFAQGGLGLPDRDYYTKTDDVSRELRKKYMDHIAALHRLAGDSFDQAEKIASTVLRIETALAEASMTNVELRDPEKQYNKMTLNQFKSLTPNIPWEDYFEVAHIPPVETVIVGQPLFFQKVTELMASKTTEDWKTYLRWHLLNSSAACLNDDFVNQKFDFYGKTLSGAKFLKPRWKRAVTTVDGAMGEALGQEYVARHFSPKAKQRINELVDNLTTVYRARIEKLDWMESATKEAAIKKLAAIKRKLGYPDTWRDYTALKINTDSYAQNCMRANAFEFQRQLNKLGKPVDRNEWEMYPQTVNAYFHPTMNEIVFPAGILQPPFFHEDADDAINYGGIGTVIGHELTHAFDDEGSKFDDQGDLRDWWTAKDREHFDAKTKKVVEQFNAFKPFPDVSVNGALTLGENIADLGGLVLAYEALQLALAKKGTSELIDGLTPNQRFFINYAQTECGQAREEEARRRINTDPHSPSQYRVNGPLANMSEFYEAFDCKSGDQLYRPEEDRAKIW